MHPKRIKKQKQNLSLKHIEKVIDKKQNYQRIIPEIILPVLKEAGVVDSGGAGLICIFEGMNSALNGDIIVYYPVLDIALELSSMGIRVDEDALRRQLAIAGCEDRAELPFQKALLAGELPYTIGGGIGQSRLCMLMLEKVHIGEVQVSVWPPEMVAECEQHGIAML